MCDRRPTSTTTRPAVSSAVATDAGLYQNTPDLQMFLGPHPDDPSIVVACGFSGSGFQFAPAVGEFVTQLCCEQTQLCSRPPAAPSATASSAAHPSVPVQLLGVHGPVDPAAADAVLVSAVCDHFEQMSAKFSLGRFEQ